MTIFVQNLLNRYYYTCHLQGLMLAGITNSQMQHQLRFMLSHRQAVNSLMPKQ